MAVMSSQLDSELQAVKMNILFVISAILSVAVAQQEPSLSCAYFAIGANLESYGCDLTINNPNGLNNFTEIGGLHLEGFSNDDLATIYTYTGTSTNVPSIICETFPNLLSASFYSLGLTEIDDIAFSGCSRLTSLNLAANRIGSISANAFANLANVQFMYMDSNFLTTLPENVFANQGRLTVLDLSFNSFQNIPTGLFRPLENLQNLYLAYAGITTMNSQWFGNHDQLNFLGLTGNRINVSVDSFGGLEGLQTLIISYNGIQQIPAEAFSRLTNLEYLYINGNELTELVPNLFLGLDNLDILDISDNPVTEINDGAFRGLENLDELGLSNCFLQQLRSSSFEGLTSLTFLSLNFNGIEELPADIFATMPNLEYIGLWYNRLKTLRRNIFGNMTNVQTLGLDGNIVNAMERALIDDATSLNTVFFNGNLCASEYFGNFLISRAEYLPMLERCFTNMRYIVDTTTEGDQFTFFDAPQPGIALRVNADDEVQIALTPFSVIWDPVIEIFIGALNNTRSIMRINEETDVVTVPTPNIIAQNQWNDFRVTWANQVVLVFRGNATFPFMTYTMDSFVPINFYGLRAAGTTASWTVQPLDF